MIKLTVVAAAGALLALPGAALAQQYSPHNPSASPRDCRDHAHNPNDPCACQHEAVFYHPVAPAVDPIALEESRLIRRCAEASWLSLCTPGERRQARLLRDAADRREALRRAVTGLLSEQQCDAAVRAALRGGDMALAREARAFCAAAPPDNPDTDEHEKPRPDGV